MLKFSEIFLEILPMLVSSISYEISLEYFCYLGRL